MAAAQCGFARAYGMISLEDCVALCDLTPDEVAAIGEHEHVPEIIASSLGNIARTAPSRSGT